MPGLAAVVIVSLGIGIGVNTAVFSWVQAMVLQPLPGVSDAAGFQLVEPRAETGSYPGVSWLEYRDLRERLRSFRDLLAFRMVPLNVGEAGRSERTYGLLVSGNYFSALGLRPALGRFLRPDEVERSGSEPVMVISHAYWQTRLGGAANVVGTIVRVNDRSLTIVGVAPERFQGTVIGLTFDVWVPATLAPELLAGSRELDDRSQRGYSIAGRLQPRTTRAQAQADLDAAMRQLAHDYPDTNGKMQGEVLSFWQAPRGPQRMLVGALAILQAVMLLLLLAVCGNTANLMLARASARYREMGVRLALGAGPWRLVRLLLTENLMLALFGAALGAVIAVWATEALRAVPMIGSVPASDSPCCSESSAASCSAWRRRRSWPAWIRKSRSGRDRARRAAAGCGTRSWRSRSASRWSFSCQPRSSSAASAKRATRILASGAKACCWPPTI